MSLGAIIDQHRLLICVGTGGVGKTTTAAAIATGAALRGRSSMVLTIDPARALARALGLTALSSDGEAIDPLVFRRAGAEPKAAMVAGMLDEKTAWDGFIARHAPSDAIRESIYQNAFYQRLSASFAGSTEFMAVEEVCRLDESGQFDLIVLDTPPAAHALDFVRAPARIDELLDPEVAKWVGRSYTTAAAAAKRASGIASRLLLAALERAAGRDTLRDIASFFVTLEALFDTIEKRTATARKLLSRPSTAFVLVTSAQQAVIDDTQALVKEMDLLRLGLRAAIINRVMPPRPATDPHALAALLESMQHRGADADSLSWLAQSLRQQQTRHEAETAQLERLRGALPADVMLTNVEERARDVHSMDDLVTIAKELWD